MAPGAAVSRQTRVQCRGMRVSRTAGDGMTPFAARLNMSPSRAVPYPIRSSHAADPRMVAFVVFFVFYRGFCLTGWIPLTLRRITEEGRPIWPSENSSWRSGISERWVGVVGWAGGDGGGGGVMMVY